ncbi:MAG: hypothetical protein AB7P02_04765 [Alphaproteobacteria bacterium]
MRFPKPPSATRPSSDLAALVSAAREIEACGRMMTREGGTMAERLAGPGRAIAAWQHYPDGGDIYDPASHAQYYFHAHDDGGPEIGHFHTFLRPAGMPPGVVPAAAEARAVSGPSHLVAIAVDAGGNPVRLFTTNRWVTDETWYPADDVVRMLDRFAIDRRQPSWALNRWLTCLFVLFRPEMAALADARDEAVRRWALAHPDADPLEDRDLETLSTIRVDLARRIAAIDDAAGD